MLKNMRAAYREGRLAQDQKFNAKMCRKALKKSPQGAPRVVVKTNAFDMRTLLRCGWSLEARSSTYAAGTGSGWTDSFVMSLPREEAQRVLDMSARSR